MTQKAQNPPTIQPFTGDKRLVPFLANPDSAPPQFRPIVKAWMGNAVKMTGMEEKLVAAQRNVAQLTDALKQATGVGVGLEQAIIVTLEDMGAAIDGGKPETITYKVIKEVPVPGEKVSLGVGAEVEVELGGGGASAARIHFTFGEMVGTFDMASKEFAKFFAKAE